MMNDDEVAMQNQFLARVKRIDSEMEARLGSAHLKLAMVDSLNQTGLATDQAKLVSMVNADDAVDQFIAAGREALAARTDDIGDQAWADLRRRERKSFYENNPRFGKTR
jgi:hypothetical protein